MTTVNEINVTFSKGSFQEWAEAAGDTYPQPFIEEWLANYNQILTDRLQYSFPDAVINVSEGYDQTMSTEIYIDFEADDDDWTAEDDLRAEINHIIDIGNNGELLDAIWTTPSVESISSAINGATDARPVGKLSYEGANFVFAKHDGAIWWMDLGTDDPLNPDDEWIVGSLEDAAIAFREEFDPEFELITQAQAAEIAGVSVAAVNNAIRDGRLIAYRRGDSPAHRPGANLVNKAELLRRWGTQLERVHPK